MPDILDLIKQARATNASDLELATKEHIAFKRLGRIEIDRDCTVDIDDMRAFIDKRLGQGQFDQLAESGRGSIEGRYRDDITGPIRIHAYRNFGGYAMSVRLLHRAVPDFAELGLPDTLGDPLTRLPGGLILVYGPTGSGKSTYEASLLKMIGARKPSEGGGKNMITICDPAEYVQEHPYSIHRIIEVGKDVDSYETAIESVLRKNPSIVELAEARSARALFGGLQSAEAGHLTFMTLHAKSFAGAIERIISAFPSEQQHQVRVVLAETLEAMVGLRLLTGLDGASRIPVWEFVRATPNIKTFIREGKTSHIGAEVAASGRLGMTTLEQSLVARVKTRLLAVDEARQHAPDKDAFEKYLKVDQTARSA